MAEEAKAIKDIEKQQAKLERDKKKILEDLKKKEQQAQKLEKLVKDSGYASARELVEALIEKYNLKLRGRRKAASTTGRRKRTKITPELRDEIKKEVKAGSSMNAVSKTRGISYAVIVKVMKGGYDKLK